jgi:predicted Rossmann fold flavoprotein
MSESVDLAIIGGGAAGLAAAIFAAQTAGGNRKSIVVLDGAKTLGAKILVSGGGRCNVTHDLVSHEDFNGSRNVVRNILAAFPVSAAVEWFSSMGVELKREETGKLFPVTDSAKTVLNALLGRCGQLGVKIQTSSRVSGILPPDSENQSFKIQHAGGVLEAARVVMATGGKSLPLSGSDGSGWEIVCRLGHIVTPTHAALAPLVLEDSMFHASLAGIAQEVELSTFANGRLIDRRAGSLLWTHFGISGPVVMDASRHWVIAHESGQDAKMFCNLLAGETFESVERWLIDLATSHARTTIANAISARLPARVAAAIVNFAGIDQATTCGQLPRENRRALVHALTALPLPVKRHRGWNYAEVTAGGVPLAEIKYQTMESRKVKGLYLTGEMLDCDGRIGGFNFQWAWANGFLAGNAAAKSSG